MRTVKYTADKKNGFQAEVITSGKSNGGGGGGHGAGDGGHEESAHLESQEDDDSEEYYWKVRKCLKKNQLLPCLLTA